MEGVVLYWALFVELELVDLCRLQWNYHWNIVAFATMPNPFLTMNETEKMEKMDKAYY
jgi:hypothetical protein